MYNVAVVSNIKVCMECVTLKCVMIQLGLHCCLRRTEEFENLVFANTILKKVCFAY